MRRMTGAGAHRLRSEEELATPRGARVNLGVHYDPEAFGRFSEAIARYFGTARFLAIQTVIVLAWIALNSAALVHHWDPYPFILLNLLFSTQAAYAAPLILLAQNRQDERDRENIHHDREVAERTQADTQFLARELASVRIALTGMATTDDVREAIGRLEAVLESAVQRVEQVAAEVIDARPDRPGGDRGGRERGTI